MMGAFDRAALDGWIDDIRLETIVSSIFFYGIGWRYFTCVRVVRS